MKLLICDDDPSTISTVEEEVDFRSLGITEILRAYNGVAAKEIIAAERPELVLCDIGMPLCSGLEVLQYVYENHIDTNFAFLTCYETFEYARAALKYGARFYLTKPVDPEELTTALRIMAAQVKEKERKKHEEEWQLRETAAVNEFFRSLRSGIFAENAEVVDSELARSGLPFRSDSRWRVVCILADLSEAVREGWEKELLFFSLRSLSNEIVARRMDFSYMLLSGGVSTALLELFIPEDKFPDEELERACKKLVAVCDTHMGVRPVCCISERCGLLKLREVIDRASGEAQAMRLQRGRVFFADDLPRDNGQFAWQFNAEEVLRTLQNGRKAELLDLVGRAVNQIARNSYDNDRHMGQLRRELRACFDSYLGDNGLDPETVMRDSAIHALEEAATRTKFDMINYAARCYDHVSALVESSRGGADVIGKAKSYIKEHFREDLNRETVAAVTFITPNYLSKRFRTETGVSLRTYINTLRVEEAKRLLLTSSASISDIAGSVGFDNISYFSTVFRRFCGMSPQEWQQSGGLGETGPKEE